jgi:hypothetical protein
LEKRAAFILVASPPGGSFGVAVSDPYFEGSTPVWSYTEYDGLGRVQYVTAPDGTVSEQVYEGFITKAIKDSNHVEKVSVL